MLSFHHMEPTDREILQTLVQDVRQLQDVTAKRAEQVDEVLKLSNDARTLVLTNDSFRDAPLRWRVWFWAANLLFLAAVAGIFYLREEIRGLQEQVKAVPANTSATVLKEIQELERTKIDKTTESLNDIKVKLAEIETKLNNMTPAPSAPAGKKR